jgi:hypothetical protein
MSNELAILTNHQPALLRPIASPKEILSAQADTTAIITEALKEGVDYGVIPGTGKKAGLFKAGAERLNNSFGVYPDYTVIEQEVDHNILCTWSKRSKKWNNAYHGDKTFTWAEEVGTSLGLYRYVVRCELKLRATDAVIAVGVGVCSSVESKYIDRPRDCENTILKMAQKRAMVGATLHAYGLSDRFTQDIEDVAANASAAGGGDVIEGELVTEGAKPPAASAGRGKKAEAAPKAEAKAEPAASNPAQGVATTLSPEGQKLKILLPKEEDRRTVKMALHAVNVDWQEFVRSGPQDEDTQGFKERCSILLAALTVNKPEPVATAAAEPEPHADGCGCAECLAAINRALDAKILADQTLEGVAA